MFLSLILATILLVGIPVITRASYCYIDGVEELVLYFDSDDVPRNYELINIHTLRGLRVWERSLDAEENAFYVEIRDYTQKPIFAANSTDSCVSFSNATTGPSDVFYLYLDCVTVGDLCNLTVTIDYAPCEQHCEEDMCTENACAYPCSMCTGECVAEGVCVPSNQTQSQTPDAPAESSTPDAAAGGTPEESTGLTGAEQAGIAVSALVLVGAAAGAGWFYATGKKLASFRKK